jgi:hypothetical protein
MLHARCIFGRGYGNVHGKKVDVGDVHGLDRRAERLDGG